jgi:nitrogen fixation/metabolism regulation signal transduction histidine kinase
MVGFNVARLVLSSGAAGTGSRLTARIVLLFALISLLPVGVVYYYSLGFPAARHRQLVRCRDRQRHGDALTLNQASLDLNQRVLLKYSRSCWPASRTAPPPR